MKALSTIFSTLRSEVAVALLTGLLTFGISLWLVPEGRAIAAAFGVVAGAVAAALDTLYFHLFFLLREAPVHTAEKRYTRGIDDAKHRLADGSIRLREALIRRFEADYQRTAATTRSDGRSKRQLREAKTRLKSRLWVIERVIPGDRLIAATAEAKTDPDLLETWSDQVDGLVDARIEVERRQGLLAGLGSRFHSAPLARQTLEEWLRFVNPAVREGVAPTRPG